MICVLLLLESVMAATSGVAIAFAGAGKAEAFLRRSSSSRSPCSIGSFGSPAYGGSRRVAPRRSPRWEVRLDLEEKSKSASASASAGALEQFKISADRKPLAHSPFTSFSIRNEWLRSFDE